MAAKDPKRRSESASIAAHWSWADTKDRTARTLPARRASIQRWEAVVDPNGEMAPAERAQAAESARRAHLRQMARKRWDKERSRRG
ncbi:hypothetical protein FHX37_0455 [Haloactinospora alba]|uniref:Uncharacterized protein n=1 Tax=Haloactinospora alba TaxID=405555 RepID=A0A543NFF6_9ACTN|nr:hypothetical protein [Haloactinospora alba]TQN30573.1 hypothetical protein FHX37_0455 [Haloactinospora alba]